MKEDGKGGKVDGKRVGRRGKSRAGKREGICLHEWNVTESLTKFCMFVFEWQCRKMFTCTIPVQLTA